MPEIVRTAYGKARVPLMKVVRGAEAHEVWELVVDVTSEGEALRRSYTAADNSPIVATDTMKNLVYYLTHEYDFSSPEDLALHIARSMQERYEHLPRWTVRVEAAGWERVAPEGISFRRTGPEKHYTTASVQERVESLASGIEDLLVLKTSGSAFSGFLRDEFTTLPETRDRVLATSMTAEWKLPPHGADYRTVNAAVRGTILEVFAELKSESVQHLAYEMARTVLERCEAVEKVELRLPNRHYFLVDLSPFGVKNEDTLYLPTTAPHGDIHLTVRR